MSASLPFTQLYCVWAGGSCVCMYICGCGGVSFPPGAFLDMGGETVRPMRTEAPATPLSTTSYLANTL